MAYIMALDQGTTSCRAIIFNHEAQQVALAQQEFKQHFPRAGWVEHDAETIWAVQLEAARNAIKGAGINASDISAIGITNQRETTVVWNRADGKPICPAIVWQDRRTAGICESLRNDGHQNTIESKTGLVIDPYFSATKIMWILENVAGAREQAVAGKLAFGTIDSWLIWNLTGSKRHLTDASNASRTMMFNINTGAWDQELLDLFSIPPSLLPEVVPNIGDLCECDSKFFGCPIPVTGMAGDQQAALFGQACITPGMAKNTYGTGCFALMNTGTSPVESHNRMLSTVAWKIEGAGTEFALEGSVFTAGAIIQWLRDGLGIIASSGDVERLATSVPDNGGVALVPAFAGLGAPHWNPDARGLICGLTRGSTSAHIARAALEGIAFQVSDVLDAMYDDSKIPIKELRVDGGGSKNDLMMQFQSDITGIAINRSTCLESTALGAALMAGIGAGMFSSSDLVKLWKSEKTFFPIMSRDEAAEKKQFWNSALARCQ